MKKNKFLSGLGAKLALAIVALTTATFTSCEKEDFEVEVKVNPAKVIISPSVVYIDEDGTATTVTNNAELKYEGATKDGIIGVIEGTEANPTIAATTVTVTATYNGVEKSEQVNISEAKANSQITYPVFIILTAPESELNYTVVEETQGTPTTVWGTPLNEGHGYTHDGHVWNENASEYFVTVKINYPVVNKQTVTKTNILSDAVGAETLNKYIEAFNYNETKEEVYNYTASAYCLFAAYITTTPLTKSINITKGEDIVAKITVEVLTGSTEAKVVEKEHPNHVGHYHDGHGHGHGDASNAGGGIIIAD